MLRLMTSVRSRLRASVLTYWPLLLLILFAAHNWFGPDIWYHLAWGREIVRTQVFTPSPAVLLTQPIPGNPTWLFQVLVYGLMHAGGPYLCGAFFIACWTAIGARWITLSGFRGDRASGLLAILLFVACVQLRLEYRPEVLSYLAMISLLGVLTSEPVWSRKLAYVGVLQVAWANVHAYYVLGPVIVGLYVIGDLVDHGFTFARLKRGVALALVATTAAFVSPTPIGSLSLVYHYATLSAALRGAIEELMPTPRFAWWYWPMPAYWTLFALVIAGALGRVSKRSGTFAASVGVLGAALSLLSFRNIPLLALAVAPIVGTYAADARPRARAWINGPLIAAAAVGAFVVSVGIVGGGYYRWLGSGTTFGMRVEPSEYPVGAGTFLSEASFRGRLFTDPNDGGYLEYTLPTAVVLGDSYYADARTTTLFFDSRNEPAVFERLHGDVKFDGAVVNVSNQNLVAHLLTRPEWTLAYADFNRLVFLPVARAVGRGLDWSNVAFTAGEDLRRAPYLDAALAWGQLGLRASPPLMKKFASDIDKEPRIPTGVVKLVLMYALLHQDRELALYTRGWRERTFTSDRADAEAIAALSTQLGL